MSLSKLQTPLKGKITAKKWVKITEILDGLSHSDQAKAVATIEDASQGWPQEIDPDYYSPLLPPSRMPKPRNDMEVRVAPRAWLKALGEGDNAPKYATVRVIMPHGNDRLRNKHIVTMLSATHLTQVRYLLLNQHKIAGSFFKALKKDHNFMELSHLRIWYNDFKPMKASVLKPMLAANLPNLRYLNLGQNYMGPEMGATFAKAKDEHLESLRSLDLSNNSLQDEGLEALCTKAFVGQLENLNLDLSGLTDGGISGLLGTLTPTMKALNLERNQLTDATMRALADATHLTSLQRLDVSQNPTTEEGIEALLTSEHLQDKLRYLRLGQGFNAALAQRMVADKLLPKLERLSFYFRDDIPEDAIAIIKEARPKIVL